MLTRGHFIGKIVDDLATLMYQVEIRNKLQYYDLTKFCEDFFKDCLNIVYNFDLTNLNVVRANNPGIDLGDAGQHIAYQITSTKTSPKITETLTAITDEQIATYQTINVFIVGEKQGQYTVDQALLNRAHFDTKKNIVDINNLLKDIVVLKTEKLEELYTFFKNNFKQVRIELEPIDSDGNFESSHYHRIEVKANKPAANARKLGDYLDEDDVTLETINSLYDELSSIPRYTRELIAIIAENGKSKSFNHRDEKWAILFPLLKNILKLEDNELRSELAILEDESLISYGESWIGDDPNPHVYVTLASHPLNMIIYWAKERNISIRKLVNTMDFTILDE